jgi:hypothetical protein
MNKEVYNVYVNDYGNRNKQFITMDMDKAVSKAIELNNTEYSVVVDVYELDGEIIYSESFMRDNNMTSEQLRDSLVNKTNKYWNC